MKTDVRQKGTQGNKLKFPSKILGKMGAGQAFYSYIVAHVIFVVNTHVNY